MARPPAVDPTLKSSSNTGGRLKLFDQGAVIGFDNYGRTLTRCYQHRSSMAENTIPGKVESILEPPGSRRVLSAQLDRFEHDGVINQDKTVFPAAGCGGMSRYFFAFQQPPPGDGCEAGNNED